MIENDSYRVRRKKYSEFLSVIQKVGNVSLGPPKWTFSEDYISALRGCWPLTFLHALELDQAHTTNGDRASKNLGRTFKIGLKFSVFTPINLG